MAGSGDAAAGAAATSSGAPSLLPPPPPPPPGPADAAGGSAGSAQSIFAPLPPLPPAPEAAAGGAPATGDNTGSAEAAEATGTLALPASVPAASSSSTAGADAASSSATLAAGGGKSGGCGKKQGNKLPSILGELGFKMTPKGLLLPESRRVTLQRRREAREMGLIPYTPPPSTLDLKGKKRKKQQKKIGMVLNDESSTLFHGAHAGDVECCYHALVAGAEVNVRTNADMDGIGTGGTALHVAAARGHDEVVKYLLEAGADANLVTGRGELPIQLATRLGHLDVVKALSSVSCATQNAEGAMQLLKTAPSYGSDKKRRKMQAALMEPVPGRPPRNTKALPPEAPHAKPRRAGVWEQPDEDHRQQQQQQHHQRNNGQSDRDRGDRGGRGKRGDRDWSGDNGDRRSWSQSRDQGDWEAQKRSSHADQDASDRLRSLPPPPPPAPDFVSLDSAAGDDGWSSERRSSDTANSGGDGCREEWQGNNSSGGDDRWQSQWKGARWSDSKDRDDGRSQRGTPPASPRQGPQRQHWQDGQGPPASEASQVAELAAKVAELQRQLEEKSGSGPDHWRSGGHDEGRSGGKGKGGKGGKGGGKSKGGKRGK